MSDVIMTPTGERHATPRPHRVGFLVLVGVLGFFSGVVGGLSAAAFLIPNTPAVVSDFLRRPSVRNTPSLASVMSATVDVFAVDAGDELPAMVPFASRIGRGVVITNDGWVVTVEDVVRTVRTGGANRRVPMVVGRDRQIRAVDRIAFDPVAPLVYLHVPDLRATALPFHERSRMDLGEHLAIPTSEHGMVAVALRSLAAPLVTSPLHSSDAWATALAFAPTTDAPVGSPVVDASGAVVGVLLASDRALPSDAITSALPTLFARGRVERNVLGMTYRDLAEFGRSERDGEGIIVERARGAGALFGRGSPLAGKLAIGDRILAIGDEPLSAFRHIGELLQEYPLGATVPLDVLRRDQRSTIPVTLQTRRGETLLVTAPRARTP